MSAQREAAIVTPIPGTTRDILSLSLDIGGLPIIISDTAGLRKTDDLVEKIGVQRAYQAYGLLIFIEFLFLILILALKMPISDFACCHFLK